MNQRPLKIVTVNTSDQGGGAERRAWCLFKGFKRRGVDSWMIVGQKKSTDPHVMALHESPHLDYRLYGLGIYQLYLRWRKSRDNHRGREDFHHPFSRHLLRLTGRRPDLVHCQNLHGGFFDLRTLARLSRRLPVFLTLHDSWTFTGIALSLLTANGGGQGAATAPISRLRRQSLEMGLDSTGYVNKGFSLAPNFVSPLPVIGCFSGR